MVSAPYELQRTRVLARPGMSEERFADILSKQVPDAEKRKRAEFIVDSSISVEDAETQVRAILEAIDGRVSVRRGAQSARSKLTAERGRMREIVFDTETTGLDPATGDRVVEIGCLELVNRLPSGETFHVYINPERDMLKEAEAVHGLSAAFLKDKPVFAQVAEAFPLLSAMRP